MKSAATEQEGGRIEARPLPANVRPGGSVTATRDAILTLSMTLFADRGYAGVSVRDIVDRAGLTPGAIYHHFSGKRQLYELVVSQAMQTVTDNLVAASRVTGSPEERLRAVIRGFAGYHFARSPEMLLLDRILLGANEEKARLHGTVSAPRHVLSGLIAELNPQVPAEDWAEHVIAAIFGAAKLRPVRAELGHGVRYQDPDLFADGLSEFVLRAVEVKET